eukprot:scaffold62041_cov69-Phaeocystis_antarctica.AAC.3
MLSVLRTSRAMTEPLRSPRVDPACLACREAVIAPSRDGKDLNAREPGDDGWHVYDPVFLAVAHSRTSDIPTIVSGTAREELLLLIDNERVVRSTGKRWGSLHAAPA